MVNEETMMLWQEVIKRFRSNLTDPAEISQMERYFPLFESFSFNEDIFTIKVKEKFHIEWFTPLYTKKLEQAFTLCGRPNVKVKFGLIDNVDKNNESSVAPVTIDNHSTVKQQRVNDDVNEHNGITPPNSLPLYENYTFKNFVEGPSNSFAYSAAFAVAKKPNKTTYNPLFIYGGTGLGKTHLMQAIGHYIIDNSPKKKVCFMTAEAFMNEYVEAMANKALNEFRSRYRNVDMLLLDDVQFLIGKKQFQEEFFNTFNALLLFQKQIVMTSDMAPRNLQGVGMDERLISRFSGGYVVEIESPSYETRLAILKLKAAASGHNIPLDVLVFIATNIKSHVRAMEGALKRVMTCMDLNPDVIFNQEMIKVLLKDLIEEEEAVTSLTVEGVIQAVASYYNVSVDDIKAENRTQAFVTPRQVGMYLSSILTTKSSKEIAKVFERKHPTIVHGRQTIKKRMEVEVKLKLEVEEIITTLGRNPAEVLHMNTSC